MIWHIKAKFGIISVKRWRPFFPSSVLQQYNRVWFFDTFVEKWVSYYFADPQKSRVLKWDEFSIIKLKTTYHKNFPKRPAIMQENKYFVLMISSLKTYVKSWAFFIWNGLFCNGVCSREISREKPAM